MKIAKAINVFLGRPLLILMYHRFTENNNEGFALKACDFEKQLRFIRRIYTIVALEEYFDLTEEQRNRIVNPAAITVDDGYMNFYQYGYPILKKLSLPATVYLPADFIENGKWMWQDRNKYILRNTSKQQVHFNWETDEYILPLKTSFDLLKSMEIVYALCMKEPNGRREFFSQSLAKSADVQLPEMPDEEFAPLTWEKIKKMENNRIYFGSHTMNHEILTEMDSSQALEEIMGSKKFIESRLSHEIKGFCYPNGCYNVQIAKQVEICGYRYAVTTEKGLNSRSDSMMCLRRPSSPESGTCFDILRGCCWRPVKDLVKSKMKERIWT